MPKLHIKVIMVLIAVIALQLILLLMKQSNSPATKEYDDLSKVRMGEIIATGGANAESKEQLENLFRTTPVTMNLLGSTTTGDKAASKNNELVENRMGKSKFYTATRTLIEFTTVTEDNEEDFRSQPVSVLLLSSNPRSGSSFVGELLATQDASVYFFEPLHKLLKLQELECLRSDECVTLYLKDKFQCRIDDPFERFFIAVYNDQARACSDKPLLQKRKCLEDFDMTRSCEESQVRIVKVIRARVRQAESLLADDSLNMKIIHLYRDPRGVMKSIKDFHWDHDTDYYCSGLSDDLKDAVALVKKYPTKIMQVSYEQVAQNPTEYAELMFNFAFGNSNLPSKTVEYIATHTREPDLVKAKQVMSRFRESSKVYQAWRNTIPDAMLQEVETNLHCRNAINLMKNRIFGNIENVRNMNISLFL